MKWIFKCLFVGCVILGVAACQNQPDSPTPPFGEVQEEENVYLKMAMSFSAKTGTRTPSDNVVTEPGKESETIVSEVLLVLADDDNRNIAAGILENASSIKGEHRNYVIGIPFRLVKNHTGETLNVYAFCNPTEELKSLAKNTPDGTLPEYFIDKIYTLTGFNNDPAWEPGHFLMSNARSYQTVLPDNWSDYRSISTPFPLLGEKELEVERTVARFDYKMIREENKYPVSSDKNDIDKTDNPEVLIQLTDAAFINASKNFYYVKRVGDEGITNINYCGEETGENFVIDTDARYKMDLENWSSKNEYFYSNMEDPDSWIWDNLSSITENEEDNVWGDDDEITRGYHIWRYIAENTAPTVISQDRKISTGIVFKGKIIPGENCSQEMKNALEKAEEPIYVFDNILYGTWSMTKKAGETNEQLRVACYAVENDKLSYEEAGFTVYKPTNGIYENYYFYWNIHNDNGIDDPMDDKFLCPMKYAVVRNNIYKLSIDGIFNFGYPDDYPSDKKDLLPRIMVSVKVLPWVVQDYELTIEE